MPQRLLVIINTIDSGGAETFVMKLFRCLDREKYVFDFLINKPGSNFYEEEIKSLGGRIFRGVPKSQSPIKAFSFIRTTVKREGYKTVFIVANHPVGFEDALACRMGGAKKLLARSTVAECGGLKSRFLAALCRPLMRSLTTIYLAPSKEAGTWLFGKRTVENNKLVVLNNGIDTSQFQFSESSRHTVRTVLGIANEFVVGHVGRLTYQKNHNKLLTIFNEIGKLRPDSVLMLVGEGNLKQDIERQAKELGISEKVFFLGIRKDVPQLLMAFDVFVFPSFYEGLPNTVVEAQATSLPCVISDTISKEVLITDYATMMSLDQTDKEWANEAIQMTAMPRKDMSTIIKNAGYSIKDTAQRFIELVEK